MHLEQQSPWSDVPTEPRSCTTAPSTPADQPRQLEDQAPKPQSKDSLFQDLLLYTGASFIILFIFTGFAICGILQLAQPGRVSEGAVVFLTICVFGLFLVLVGVICYIFVWPLSTLLDARTNAWKRGLVLQR